MGTIIHEWKGVDAVMHLADEDVQVWLGEVPTDDLEIASCVRRLDTSEQLRMGQFRDFASRNQFIFGRAMLRQLLGKNLDIDTAEVAFSFGTWGKPQIAGIAGDSGICFNVAHSHSLVAIALAWRRQIGVDIEWNENSMDWRIVADRVLSANELYHLKALPITQQKLAFFTIWTRKEAYLKATGEGLTGDLSAIEVTVSPEKSAKLLRLPKSSDDPVQWNIQDIVLPRSYVGALVTSESAWRE